MMAGSIIVSDLGPTGPAGVTGPTGRAAFTDKGVWDVGTTYEPTDFVIYFGLAYVLLGNVTHSGNPAPPDDSTYWFPFAAPGPTGPEGPGGGGGGGSTGPTGPAGAGGGGGGGVTIFGSAATTGALLTVTGTTGAFANADLTFNAGILSLTGGFRLTNGFRPPYVEVKTGTSITPAANSYGTYYDIQTSAITGLSIGYPVTGSNNWSNDANAGWLFRNNSGSYLSLTVTYTSATPNIYPTTITIAPDTGVTLMAVYPGGGVNSNYVLF